MIFTTPALSKRALHGSLSIAMASVSQAATLSTGDLGSLGIGIVHGTELGDPAVMAAMDAAIGISIEGGSGSRISAYDTEVAFGSSGFDPDLERNSNDPPGTGPGLWAGGNLPLGTQLGIIAIIQEPGQVGKTGNIFNGPNDAGAGGNIIYNVRAALGFRQLTVTAIDAEEDPSVNPNTYQVRLNDTYLVDVAATSVADGLAPVFGGRTLNSFGTVNLYEVSGGAETIITKVEYIINGDSGGSGAIRFDTVPEPSSALLALLGLGFALRRKR